ncbi:hypothetical protein ES703_39918 [subsurface metagenome]
MANDFRAGIVHMPHPFLNEQSVCDAHFVTSGRHPLHLFDSKLSVQFADAEKHRRVVRRHIGQAADPCQLILGLSDRLVKSVLDEKLRGVLTGGQQSYLETVGLLGVGAAIGFPVAFVDKGRFPGSAASLGVSRHTNSPRQVPVPGASAQQSGGPFLREDISPGGSSGAGTVPVHDGAGVTGCQKSVDIVGPLIDPFAALFRRRDLEHQRDRIGLAGRVDHVHADQPALHFAYFDLAVDRITLGHNVYPVLVHGVVFSLEKVAVPAVDFG